MTNQEKALELHEKLQGKLETVSKTPVRTREDLALVYTPGVAEPCKDIAKDPGCRLHLYDESKHCSCCFRRFRRTGTRQYRSEGRYARYGRQGCLI